MLYATTNKRPTALWERLAELYIGYLYGVLNIQNILLTHHMQKMKQCKLVCACSTGIMSLRTVIKVFLQSSGYSAHSSSMAPAVCCLFHTHTHLLLIVQQFTCTHGCVCVWCSVCDVVWVGGGRTSSWIVSVCEKIGREAHCQLLKK